MKDETYKALLKDLQKLQKGLVASQIAEVRRNRGLWAKMEGLHAAAEVGGAIDDYVAMTARKSTVLFLLRTVFVRVLEDLGILGLRRIRDDWGFAAFREVGPALGKRAYFAFVFRDLSLDFPALFTAGPDELPLPDEDGCRALWDIWHHPNKEGEMYLWNGEGFDSRFLGDLYQDLDADIRKRYALLQTPRFVEEYILDHTLTPALVEFDPAALREKGERFRMIDPTCGSGHFLIGAFHRLADYWRDRHGLSEWDACERAAESVWGCDINPHAVEIAAFRLMLEVVGRTRVTDLERLSKLVWNLRAMDSLIPWERATGQVDLFTGKDRLDSYATPKERDESATFLKRDFHVVVGNPPYIRPKDRRKLEDYKVFWPKSAVRQYALSAPFAERFFCLAFREGFVGQITANSFAKRSFGKSLVQNVLNRLDLTHVIDSSGAYIPGHGTPTVILLGRNRTPTLPAILAILGKRGEPRRPQEPERGVVWMDIARAGAEPDDSSLYVTVALVSRQTFASHPWVLGGGLIPEIIEKLEVASGTKIHAFLSSVGNRTQLQEDELYLDSPPSVRRDPDCPRIELLEGEYVRDWSLLPGRQVPYPYVRGTKRPLRLLRNGATYQHFWRYRDRLFERPGVGFRTVRARGQLFYEYPLYAPETTLGLCVPLGFVSTHNHFVLDRGGRVFKQTAPVIKLSATATLEVHLELLGLLNSSSLGFWMRQIFHDKGNGGVGGGIAAEDWERFYEYDSTKLQQAPITSKDREPRIALARSLDSIAQERAACLPAAILASDSWSAETLPHELTAAHVRYLDHTRRMVALQEELDWLTYGSYGLIDPIPTVAPDSIEPLAPGHRPFEIVFARKDDEADDDEKSAWWSRHGHDRVTEIPSIYSAPHRERLQQRIDLIESDPRIALLETAPYKRRWQLADWPSETKKAAESWLLDRLEDLFAPGTDTTSPGPLATPEPYRLEDIAHPWSADPRVAAVAGLWTGTGLAVDVTIVAETLLRNNALPDNPHRLYSAEGLRKLDEWKRVWALQDQEDAWEKAVSEAKERGDVPPPKRLVDPLDPEKVLDAIPLPRKFEKTDFVRPESFAIRGKLNVPRERFIVFTELSPPRYGWNGWRNLERTLAQVRAFEIAEGDPIQPLPVPTPADPRRCGVTFGLWESLADLRRWGDPGEHAELRSLAREACRKEQCPCPLLDAWKAAVLAPSIDARKGKSKKLPIAPEPPEEPPSDRPPIATVAERAWVAGLFPRGKDLEIAALWSVHRARLSEPPQRTLPGVQGPPAQLLIPETRQPTPAEPLSMDEARLAFVLDDLVASGDVEVRGRGKKRRYKLVPRGLSS